MPNYLLTELSNDLNKIDKLAHQWKRSFNPDHNTQTQEFIFSRKVSKESHPLLIFNNNVVYQATSQKLLGIILDNCLSFEEHNKTSTYQNK